MKQLKRIHILILVLTFVMILSSGCTNKVADEDKNDARQLPAGGKEVVIGVSVLDLANPYYVQLLNGIRQGAATRNARLMIDDPKSDVNRQIQAVEEFIAAGVDAIIIAALDQNALEDVLKKAKDHDIKIVAQSTKVDNCDIFVSFDEWDMGYTIGQVAGRWIRDKLGGQSQVAILNYPRIAQIAKREKGIRDGISEYAPKAAIAAVASSANPEEGEAATLQILKQNPEIKVVVGINDGGALGALAAFEKMGKTADDVFIGGIDATPEAISRIKSDSLYRATVDINPFYNGILDVDFAVKLIKGQIVPDAHSENAVLVTKENVHMY